MNILLRLSSSSSSPPVSRLLNPSCELYSLHSKADFICTIDFLISLILSFPLSTSSSSKKMQKLDKSLKMPSNLPPRCSKDSMMMASMHSFSFFTSKVQYTVFGFCFLFNSRPSMFLRLEQIWRIIPTTWSKLYPNLMMVEYPLYTSVIIPWISVVGIFSLSLRLLNSTFSRVLAWLGAREY